MDARQKSRIREIFAEAAELPLDRRAAFLDFNCGGDAFLRREVDSLLAASGRAGAFLASPTVHAGGDSSRLNHLDQAACAADSSEQLRQIGHFRLLERIGEGGFGDVWTAEQCEPVRRTVALKILKPGMDSREVLARFEAERQALALMDHPNVARIYDAGQSETGRPFFVMEHVPGQPITEYCDAARLNVRQRLELFIAVCQAVQHAHQKGVIHRDLKPSNILVTLVDGQPVPKVIDFGIAKATTASLSSMTVHTELGRLMGTPDYMSPEQAGTSGLDVDTRSDVYSLGVILYQLLTGTLPFEPQTLRKSDYSSMVKIIREQEPPAPSTRLSTLGGERVNQLGGATPADLAKKRNVEFAALARQVRGELDWVVMKCLEKDRARRYETASGLAADVQRHLAAEPVVAAPPSRLYRISKLWRRYRPAILIASSIVVLILGALAVTLQQWQQAVHARARADAFNVFLKQLLTAAQPARSRGEKLTVREVLDDAAKRIEAQPISGQPLVEAEIRSTIGETYFALGLFGQAQSHLRAADEIQSWLLGDEHPDVLRTRSQLARCYAWAGEGDLAVSLARPTLERQRRVLGEDDPETLRTLSFLGNGLLLCMQLEESEACLRQALAGQQRRLGTEHEDTIETMFYLSWSIGPFSEESIDIAREALEIAQRTLGPDHPHTSYASLFLGMACRYNRRTAEAESHLRRALEETRRVFGEEHVRTADCLAELGTTLENLGRAEEGINLLRQSVDIARRTYGPGRKWTLRYQETLGFLLNESSRWTEAAEVLTEALSQARRARGDEDFETLNILCNYSISLQNLDRLEEAAACAAEAFETASRINGPQLVTTRDFGRRYAAVLWKLGRRDDSLAVIQNTLDVTRGAFGSGHPQMVEELYQSAWFLHDRGRNAEAEPLARESVEGYRVMDSKFKTMGSPQDILARIVSQLGRPREALELALEAARAPEANAQHLNLAATYLLSTPIVELRDPELALEFSRKANELGRYESPNHLETLARILHRTGEIEKAIELLRKAALLNAAKPDAKPSDLHRMASRLLKTPTDILHDPALGLELAVKAARHPEASAVHLNFAAWQLLTTPCEEMRDSLQALEFALKANEIGGYEIPSHLDTLALASHRTGDTATAIALQQKAIALLPPDAPSRDQYETQLCEFERAAESGHPPADAP